MSKLNNVTKSVMSNPLVLVTLVLFVLLIILAVIRVFLPNFSTGIGLNAHFGSIKGGINLEAFQNENQPSLVIFKAEWCGHCKRTMPEVQKLMNKNLENVKIVVVDSDQQPDLVKAHGVQGFPTIRMYPQGLNNKENYTDYEGERNVEGFTTFLERLMKN